MFVAKSCHAVLARVIPEGPACHLGAMSCFGDPASSANAFGMLDSVIEERARNLDQRSSSDSASSEKSYTRRLLTDRNLRLKKIGEESAELVLACADEDKPKAVEEAADLFYHALVALRSMGATLDDLGQALTARLK